MSTTTTPQHHVARKVHHCSLCLRRIDPGETYQRVRTFHGADAGTFKSCAHCTAVIDIWAPTDYDDLHSEDVFDWWSEGPAQDRAEERAMAGWRTRWRDPETGDLLSVPQSVKQCGGDDA